MNNNSLRIENKEDSTDIYIVGEIGWEFTQSDLIEQLKDHKKDINLYISSAGGSVFEGWAMMSVLKRTGANITAHIDGIAASMASGIAMVADKVLMSDTGMFMLHNASGIVWGNKEEMLKTATLLEKIDSVLIDTYAKASGKDKEEVKDMMNAETWLTAQEAVDHGFVDELVEMIEAKNCAMNCELIDSNKFHYEKIPEDKILDMKKLIKVDQENTMTRKGIADMINDLKSSQYYKDQ